MAEQVCLLSLLKSIWPWLSYQRLRRHTKNKISFLMRNLVVCCCTCLGPGSSSDLYTRWEKNCNEREAVVQRCWIRIQNAFRGYQRHLHWCAIKFNPCEYSSWLETLDKKCPFTGNIPVRGRIFTGKVVSTKMNRTCLFIYVSHASVSRPLRETSHRPLSVWNWVTLWLLVREVVVNMR